MLNRLLFCSLYFVAILAPSAIFAGSKQSETKQIKLLLEKADASFKEARRAPKKYKEIATKAKIYLKEAARLGSAEAFFLLGHNSPIGNAETVKYYQEAAVRGHESGFHYYIDSVFYRGENIDVDLNQFITVGELYAKASGQAYPLPKALKLCLEAEPFDGMAFSKEYDISQDLLRNSYPIWILAEQAATTSRFGSPNAKLVLNLVCHGGFIPAEMDRAVPKLYDIWKLKKKPRYNICDHVSGNWGIAFCSNREERQ